MQNTSDSAAKLCLSARYQINFWHYLENMLPLRIQFRSTDVFQISKVALFLCSNLPITEIEGHLMIFSNFTIRIPLRYFIQ